MKQTETIVFDDREIEVTGYYLPEEPMVMYYSDGSGHPGSPSDFDLLKIEINNKDVTNDYDENIEEVIELVINQIEGKLMEH